MADTDIIETDAVPYRGDKYVVIDTVIPSDKSYWAPQINGRQGDNMRPVNICLQHDGVNWNLGNYTVDLVGRDNKGVLKETNTVQKIVAERGLICVSVPQQFYQAVGDYQECFLEIKDEAGTVVSSVRVAFTVWANNTLVSRVESETYLNTIDQFMKNCESMIDTIQDNAKSAKQQIDALNDLLKTYQALVQANAVALLNKEQTFGAKQTFGDAEVTGTLTANKLAGQAMNDIMIAIDNVPKVTTTTATRENIVFSDGASAGTNNYSLIVQRTDFGNGTSLIAGVGDVSFDVKKNTPAHITLPWAMGAGSALVFSDFEYNVEIRAEVSFQNDNQIEINFNQDHKGDEWIRFLVASINYKEA